MSPVVQCPHPWGLVRVMGAIASRTLHKLRGAGLTQGLLVRRGRVRLHVRRQGSSAINGGPVKASGWTVVLLLGGSGPVARTAYGARMHDRLAIACSSVRQVTSCNVADHHLLCSAPVGHCNPPVAARVPASSLAVVDERRCSRVRLQQASHYLVTSLPIVSLCSISLRQTLASADRAVHPTTPCPRPPTEQGAHGAVREHIATRTCF